MGRGDWCKCNVNYLYYCWLLFYTKSQERELALRTKYKAELDVLSETVQQNAKGYALKEDVERGSILTKDLLVEVTLPNAAKSVDALELIDVNNFTHFARTDLKANTVLVDSMVYKEENVPNDLREGEYSFIELPTNLKSDDFVDVRIQFPNGDDYIFLSKKKVKDVVGLTLWVDMNEGEQLTMSSAIVDAFVEEAKIYAMPYVDGPMQAASQVTYPVKSNVLELINESPNIVNRATLNLERQNRQRLENELNKTSKEERMKLREGQSKNDNAREQDDAERELNEMNNQSETPSPDELIGNLEDKEED